MISNRYVISGLTISLFTVWICAYLWKSPEVNWEGEKNLYQYLQQNPHQSVSISSMGNTFRVDYIQNASTHCINPYFPVIRITTEEKHNGWIQIVHTDTQDNRWQKFVDTTADAKTAPFYTYDQDFYDAPLWTYKLCSKPLTFWQGHAYAVQIDPENKTIKCIGGVKWGFTLPVFKIRPYCLTPRPLCQEEWNKDWEFFHTSIPDYDSLPID